MVIIRPIFIRYAWKFVGNYIFMISNILCFRHYLFIKADLFYFWSFIMHFRHLNVDEISWNFSQIFCRWWFINIRACYFFRDVSLCYLSQKTTIFCQKSASNFFGSQSGKMKLIFLIYTFFRTSMQKIEDGLIFFFSKGFGLADIRPLNPPSQALNLPEEAS